MHPLYYIIDDREYIPGVEDMPVKEFYRALKEGKMPTTSASNPINIIAKFQKEINEGHDILHLSFSSGLSSSYNNARICAEKLMEEKPGSKIIVIDTLSGTVGQGILLMKAVEMKKAGKTIDEIAEDFALYERDTLEDAISELFDDEKLSFILELIAKDEINEYIEEHIAKYQRGYLINFNECF